MTDAHKARFSRDGDQFHYLWAARRCLRLLQPSSKLVAVSIEGPSPDECENPIEGGEEVIDVAEYYDSEDLSKCTLVRYSQLKHSTQIPEDPWTPSGLERTIRRFAARYAELFGDNATCALKCAVEFAFVSNRPIAKDVLETIEDIVNSAKPRHDDVLQKLKAFVALDEPLFTGFCKTLSLDGNHLHYQLQRDALSRETHAYLPDNDVTAPTQLKDLVTKRALSESILDPCIRKVDVLRALGTTEDELFPAESRLEGTAETIARAQEAALVSEIVSSNVPIVIHAAGGIGKSIFSQRISLHLPPESICLVYDCFGNGEYRQRSRPRHRHKDALVQIANELSRLGLCDPLIPTSKADASAYAKAFVHRLQQSADVVRGRDTNGLICIVIDAADNAEMAADEFGELHSFARDLLREALPASVRLVALCRSERLKLLDLAPSVTQLELDSFTVEETSMFLRTRYPDASEHDVAEFHKTTAGNPRVQINALSEFNTLPEILRSLAPNLTTVDAIIEQQLERALARLTDSAAKSEKEHIQLICSGLALLKPLVPISVLAKLSGAPEAEIRSFATDFGRPLLISGDSLQFRDEPVETWFRTKFRSSPQQIGSFIDQLMDLAEESAYIAASLPYLMLEAGRLNELVSMTLDGKGLPDKSPIDKREIELQRLQFSLRACLRQQRHGDAAKLAIKAGAETAGDSRQRKLLQKNTDLIAALMETSTVQEIAFGRRFDANWLGGQYAYEAALLSYADQFRGDARSRLRMAHEWLMNWSTLPKEDRRRESIENLDIAEMAIAHFNIHGGSACVKELNSWSHKLVPFYVGRIIARRLVDAGNYHALDAITEEASSSVSLLLAIALELRSTQHRMPNRAVRRAITILKKAKAICDSHNFRAEEAIVLSVASIVEQACLQDLDSHETLAKILDKYLPADPPRALASRYQAEHRFAFLCAYTLRAALREQTLELHDLAHRELREQLLAPTAHQDSSELREFRASIGAVLPWHKLRVANLLAKNIPPNLSELISLTRQSSSAASSSSYRENSDTSDEVAKLWFEILSIDPANSQSLLSEFTNWISTLHRPLFIPTWNALARSAARTPGFAGAAFEFCKNAFQIAQTSKLESESKADTYIECARALLVLDQRESKEYFDQAISVVSRLGDDVCPRWEAMSTLADHAGNTCNKSGEIAYRFARCAEVAKEYAYDNFDWDGTIISLCNLHPSAALATISRWRDRRFGSITETLPVAVLHLLRNRQISPHLASILFAFQCDWDFDAVLESSLEMLGSQAEKQDLMNYLSSYLLKLDLSTRIWEQLKAVAQVHSVTVPSNLAPTLLDNDTQNESLSEIPAPSSRENHHDWNSIFGGSDLSTTVGLETAYKLFREGDPPLYHEYFWKEAISRVPIGQEVDFLKAYSNAVVFDLFNLKEILQSIPDNWKSRMSIMNALQDAVRLICTRHCFEITNSKRYQPFPLQLAAEVNMSTIDVVGIVLKALGERVENYDTTRLFSLIGLLTPSLSPQEAHDALEFALTLFEEELNAEDGDGEWSANLEVPTDLSETVAQFLWAFLAAPEASLRWQAAHAVRGAAVLHQQSVIDALIDMINELSGGAFSDSNFHFYHFHSQLYLLIALSRIAIESPDSLRAHMNAIAKMAIDGQPHVLIKHFAQRTALALEREGSTDIPEDTLARLKLVNQSPFQLSPPVREIGNPPEEEKAEQEQDDGKEDDDDSPPEPGEKFFFGIDIPSYWFSNIAECFGTSVPYIEKRAQQIISGEWKHNQNGHWKRDARHQIYNDRETYHSHGSYPKTDNLGFYLSYHSMMVVAGELLNTHPVKVDCYEPDLTRFESWLNRHLLTRKDGRWLADRIDPKPVIFSNLRQSTLDEHWRWSVGNNEFNTALGLGTKRRVLWAYWKEMYGEHEETVHIYSSLVSSTRSEALLRALQTTDNYYCYKIPDSGDDKEISFDGYELKGWIESDSIGNHLDKFDPWAGNIRYPPLKPAGFITQMFDLNTDYENRVWQLTKNGDRVDACWSLVWGNWNGGEQGNEHGHRIEASEQFLEELLLKSEMHLITKVTIKRHKRRRYYGSRENNDEIENVQPYCKLFLFKPGRKIVTL